MQNLIDMAMEEWRTAKVSILIWGGAELGGKISKWLDENKIVWESYAVNRECYDEKTVRSRTVVLEDYLEHNQCIIIVGFVGYNPQMLEKLDKRNILKIYTLDFQGRFAAGWDTMISEQYLSSKIKELDFLQSHLSDEESKEALKAFIHQKMYSEYEKPYSKCRQYFEDDIIRFEENEIFIDCGGFDGEDTFYFLDQVKGKNGKAYIFEPDPSNCNNIKNRFKKDDNVIIYNMGASDSYSKVCFESNNGSSSKITEDGDIIVEVNALDNVLENVNVTFLKMDIEGFELQALKGAERLIRRCRPKMAICVYHRKEDIFTIPQYILGIHNDYKIYIRNYHRASTETVLYAI